MLNRQRLQRLGFKKKLLYDVNGLSCSFCKQQGHAYHFCVGRESIPTPEQRCDWTQGLIDSDPFDNDSQPTKACHWDKRSINFSK